MVGLASLRDPDPNGCEYFQQCLEFVRDLPETITAFCEFESHMMCYCNACHKSRGDRAIYDRGGKNYGLPIGWVRFALRAGGMQAKALGAFNWHCAFHGTHRDALPLILGTGRLVKPGDSVAALGGNVVAIRKGHIR